MNGPRRGGEAIRREDSGGTGADAGAALEEGGGGLMNGPRRGEEAVETAAVIALGEVGAANAKRGTRASGAG